MRRAQPPEKAPLWIDLWACATGERLQALSRDVRATIEANEVRTRARRPSDQATFARCVEAIVCNLALSALAGEGAPIGVPLRKAHPAWKVGRYTRHGLKQETFRKVLDAMDGEYLTLNGSPGRGVSSSIVPTPAFVSAGALCGVAASEIGKVEGEEPIVLTRKLSDDEREFIDYSDTPQTNALRQEVKALNEWLDAAPISFVQDGEWPPICVSQRRLYRSFLLPSSEHPIDFAHGGRLYGGFWEHLSRTRRRDALRINGERIAEVDFSAMFLRLASAQGGVEINTPDPYSALAGLGDNRKSLKMAVAALLFSPTLRHWPSSKKALPPSVSPKAFRAELIRAFPGLAHCFAPSRKVGIGYELFRRESDILLRALGLLRADGVVALPLHDAVLVAQSAADLARRRLEQAGVEVAGVSLPVEVWRRSEEQGAELEAER